MKNCYFLLAFLLAGTGIFAQEKDLTKPPAGAASFIPAGFNLLDYETGDLNGDGKKDIVLVLKRENEDTLEMGDGQRPLLLLVRQPNNSLKLALRNDSLVMCRQCGGIFGDPYESIRIAKNTLIVNFYGGSAWRWGYEYQFVYEAAGKTWWLNKETDFYYHNAEPDKMKTTVYTREELGRVALQNFSASSFQCAAKYRVTAAKTYFYDQPNIKGKPRKGYLIKGNEVNCSRQTTHFIQVYYSNNKGQSSEGFILKKDAVPVNQ